MAARSECAAKALVAYGVRLSVVCASSEMAKASAKILKDDDGQ